MSKNTRPSPSISATEQKIGTMKIGNDKNKWIVLPTEKGILRWVKLFSPIKNYFTHWNGGRPYKVIVTDKTIIVLKPNKNQYDKYENFVIKIDNYKKVFVGQNTNKFGGYYKEKFTGNSILIEIKLNEYIYIGKNIYKFTTTTEINKFYSIMGNNDVPYPFAVSSDKIFLLIENISVDTELWNEKIDPYKMYYEMSKNVIKDKTKKIIGKYIDKNNI